MQDVFLKEIYGNINEMNSVSLPDEVNETILSYDGFEADGEFNKTTSKHMGKSTNNTNQKSVNNLEIFLTLNQVRLKGMYFELVKDFGNKFLQTCYN